MPAMPILIPLPNDTSDAAAMAYWRQNQIARLYEAIAKREMSVGTDGYVSSSTVDVKVLGEILLALAMLLNAQLTAGKP